MASQFLPEITNWFGYVLGGIFIILLYAFAIMRSLSIRKSDSLPARLLPTALITILMIPWTAICIGSIAWRDMIPHYSVATCLGFLHIIVLGYLLVRVWTRW